MKPLILFAAACLAVPIIIALLVIVVLSLADRVEPALSPLLLPLLAVISTSFAAFSAWQSAKNTEQPNTIIARLYLSESAVEVISLLNRIDQFFTYEAVSYGLQKAISPHEDEKKFLEELIVDLFGITPQLVRFGFLGRDVQLSITRARYALIAVSNDSFSHWIKGWGNSFEFKYDEMLGEEENYFYALAKEVREYARKLERHIDVSVV